MSGMIKISGNSVDKNNPPSVTNLRIKGQIEGNRVNIIYNAKDFENTILRQYIYINGSKKEITKEVGYEQPNNEFVYNIKNLEFGTQYDIQIEVTDGLKTAISNILKIKTQIAYKYGVRVDENNSSPQSCCSYINDSINFNTANSTSLGDWANKFPYNEVKIVGFKDGLETKEINPNNKTQYKDGSSVPLNVDVMIKIPKVYWKFTKLSNGYEVNISNIKIDSEYDCYAHKINDIEKDYIYVGAYLGSVSNGKLRSTSNVPPTVNTSLSSFRNYAHANGEGYQQMNWNVLILLQILYLIAYKSLDSQSALGMGVCSGSRTNTGGTIFKGLIYGDSNKSHQVCFLGIEDLWGNVWQWIDGLYFNGTNLLVTPDNRTFNDIRNDYKVIDKFSSINGGNPSKVIASNQGGFLSVSNTGSSTTYYCDYQKIDNNSCAFFGGHYADTSRVGIFYLYLYYTPDRTSDHLGARLCYLG